MCWLCDHPGATRADYHDVLRRTIRKNGWAVQYVEDEPNPFAYTVGLHEAGLPELLVTSVTPSRAAQLLDAVGHYMLGDRVPVPGDTITLPDCEAEFLAVAQPDAHLCFAVELYGPEVRALQLAWCDESGHSPWCPDFNRNGCRQPVLGKRGQHPGWRRDD